MRFYDLEYDQRKVLTSFEGSLSTVVANIHRYKELVEGNR
jgi:hypothetical protein